MTTMSTTTTATATATATTKTELENPVIRATRLQRLPLSDTVENACVDKKVVVAIRIVIEVWEGRRGTRMDAAKRTIPMPRPHARPSRSNCCPINYDIYFETTLYKEVGLCRRFLEAVVTRSATREEGNQQVLS
jgi:hypothetical protein